jgi:hypothetical protein
VKNKSERLRKDLKGGGEDFELGGGIVGREKDELFR